MKKGLIIVGECILLVIVLLCVKIALRSMAPNLADNDVVNFVLYFLSGMGSVLIYRFNTRNKKG